MLVADTDRHVALQLALFETMCVYICGPLALRDITNPPSPN